MKKIIFAVKIVLWLSLVWLCFYIVTEKIALPVIDLGRHLKNGQLVFSFPQLLYQNFYSYTQGSFSFINHHWMSGLLFFWVQSFFGWAGLSIFNSLLLLAAFVLAFSLAVKKGNFWVAWFLALPAVLLMSERTEIRPETISTFFVLFYIFLLDKYLENKDPKYLFWLLPLQLLWANFHIYSFIGLALVGLALVGQLVEGSVGKNKVFLKNILNDLPKGRFFQVLVGCVLVSLATPNFIRGFLYPLKIFENYGYEIVENKNIYYIQSLMIDYNILIFKTFFFGGLVVLSWAGWKKKKINVYETLTFIFFGIMGIFALRNIAIFGLICLVFLSEPIRLVIEESTGKIKYQAWKIQIIFSMAAVLISAAVFWSVFSSRYFGHQGRVHNFGLGLENDSEAAGKFLASNRIERNIFNDYDIGSYLDYYLAPQGKVFVDNRPEAYSVDFFEDYRKMQTDEDFWHEQLDKNNFEFIVFDHTDGTFWAKNFMEKRFTDSEWKLVYLNSHCVILARDVQPNKKIIEENLIEKNCQDDLLEKLYDQANQKNKINIVELAGLMKCQAKARELAERLERQQANNFQPKLVLAGILSDSQEYEDLKRSKELTLEAIGQGAKLSSAYNQLGVICAKKGDGWEARAAWEKSLQINPGDEWAKYYLSKL